MKAAHTMVRLAVLILALALCGPAMWAQQKDPDPRINPPLQPREESSSKAPTTTGPAASTAAPAAPQADTRPLTGAEEITLGSLSSGHTYVLPSFSFTQGLDKNEGSSVRYHGSLHGNLAMHRESKSSQMMLNYTTGAVLGGGANGIRSQAHSFSFMDSMQFRRWTVMFGDTFNLLPGSAFGFGGFHGIGPNSGGNLGGAPNWIPGQSGGLGQSNLNPFFVPNQTILSGNSSRYSNTVLGQVAYMVSPRMSWTATGSFGVMRFFKPGFSESNSSAFRTGLNYQFTARDTVAVSYGLNMVRFNGSGALNNHVFHVSYGRRLTGRLALSVAAGPNFNQLHSPVQGDRTRSSWSTSTSLTSFFGQTTMGLSYSLSTTSGSGVQLGARTHWLMVHGGRQLTTQWNLSWNGAYAHNTGLSLLNNATVRRTFDSWRAGFNLSRPVGRSMRMGLRYQLTMQHAGCFVTTVVCQGPTLRHQFGINLSFSHQFDPIELN